ncbi:MAG TPA: hypothetical protein VND99_00990 [Candidatus Acidoferrales bacterium]|nr:hypothetical protein [Candidatus Acidoferrales bacterium]
MKVTEPSGENGKGNAFSSLLKEVTSPVRRMTDRVSNSVIVRGQESTSSPNRGLRTLRIHIRGLSHRVPGAEVTTDPPKGKRSPSQAKPAAESPQGAQEAIPDAGKDSGSKKERPDTVTASGSPAVEPASSVVARAATADVRTGSPEPKGDQGGSGQSDRRDVVNRTDASAGRADRKISPAHIPVWPEDRSDISSLTRARFEQALERSTSVSSAWTHVDSAGEIKDAWRKGRYNSPIEVYEERIKGVLNGKSLIEIMSQSPVPFILDIFAPSWTLRDAFSKMPNAPQELGGASVSRTDERTPEERARDRALGIDQWALNLLDPSEWDTLEANMGGKKAGVILEFGGGGVDFMPRHPLFFTYASQRVWNLLSERNGILVAELPIYAHIPHFKETLERAGIEGDIDTETKSRDVFYMIKTPDSPSVLPRIQMEGFWKRK